MEEVEAYKPEVVVQLRPTSPIRPRAMVDEAVGILLAHEDADSVRGVVPAGQNPYKMWRLPEGENGPMKNLIDVEGLAEPYNAPRQILPPAYWQTGHIDAIRLSTIAGKKSLTGDVVYPLLIDPRYTVDIDTLADWAKYEALVSSGLEMVYPGDVLKRPLPETVKLLVLDFDGVVSNNLVWTDQDGREMVAASRSDSLFIEPLREVGVETVILSSEINPVVAARAKKMGIDAVQGLGLHAKGPALKRLLEEKKIDPAQVVYVGNDVNDLPCFALVGWSVAVADAYPEVKRAADFVLSKPGGGGALRELCEIILKNL